MSYCKWLRWAVCYWLLSVLLSGVLLSLLWGLPGCALLREPITCGPGAQRINKTDPLDISNYLYGVHCYEK